MLKRNSSRFVLPAAVMAVAIPLAGCVGGTTYGTGVSQEEQTLKDFYNMFTLNRERKSIDYSARPDLVVPQDKAALPEPLDESVATNDPAWPETPEERIARVRAEAGEIDARTGDYSINERLRKKEGIAVEQARNDDKFVPGRTDRDGNPVLYDGNSQARQDVLKARASLDYSRGAKRKYLTEPPVEYRTPAETAPTGEEAYTDTELARRKAQKEEERKAQLKKLQEHN